MKIIKVKCENCGNIFEKLLKEFTRAEKIGRKNFCNRSCSTSYRNKNMNKDFWKTVSSNINIKNHSGNRLTEYTPFKIYLRKGRASIIKHKDNIDIDEKYLKDLWDRQKGICPYTGIKMELMKTSSQNHKLKSLKKASLDRIDSSKGYTKDNVEFVCMAINNAKNDFKKEEMKSFIKEIISSQNNLSITQEQPT